MIMKENDIKTGIIYCRVSSAEQVENTSLESQEERCKEYAKRENIKITKVFIEKGESAKTANRTEFNKAIEFCGKNKKIIDYFIVYKIDRFARNQTDHVITQAILKKCGVALRSTTEPINETSVGRLMEGVLSSFAEFDNNVRTERSIGGMREKLKQGVWVWQAPFGFHRLYKGANITPEENMSPFIKLAFEEWSKGTYSYESLAEYLFKRGFVTKAGKEPTAQLMEKIIKNPIYCGIMIGLGGEFEGAYTPIISKELWEQCQTNYKKKKLSAHRSINNPKFPLRRICVCTECNKSLTASNSKGRSKSYSYYHHQKQDCLKAKFIPTETFEQLFVEYLDEINPSKKYEEVFKAIMIDIWQSNYKKFNEDNKKINKKIDSLGQDRDKIFDLHRSNIYSDEEFAEQKKMINQKIYDKRQLLQDNHIEEFNMEEALDHCFNFVSETSKNWLRMKDTNPDRLLWFQKQVFPEKITFDGEKFGTANLGLVYKLSEECGDDKSQLVTLRGIEPRFPG